MRSWSEATASSDPADDGEDTGEPTRFDSEQSYDDTSSIELQWRPEWGVARHPTFDATMVAEGRGAREVVNELRGSSCSVLAALPGQDGHRRHALCSLALAHREELGLISEASKALLVLSLRHDGLASTAGSYAC